MDNGGKNERLFAVLLEKKQIISRDEASSSQTEVDWMRSDID